MKKPSVELLPAGEEHLPALAGLAELIWRQYYPGIISHEQIDYMLGKMYALETLRDEMRKRGVRFIRLLVDERFVGFASFGPLPEPGVFKLHKCYLLPEFHGRGLGSTLLRHCEDEIRRLGGHELKLTVNKQNVKAIAAYKSNGFVVEQSVVTQIGGGFVMDDFVMIKLLAV